jgi:hypothetical protein
MKHTMSIKKFEKLKHLLNNWLAGTIKTSDNLIKNGFSRSDIQKYLSSGWIEQVGHGAYKKQGENISWQGAVYGLKDKAHVGGRSALSLRGMGHYLNLGIPQIDLFSNDYQQLPKWFRGNNWDANFKHLRVNFLPNIAIDEMDVGAFTILVSTPERAAIEIMCFLNKIYSFEEIKLLSEHLIYLRPSILQELLEHCTSIKAKRLILYFGHSMNLPWYTKIDLKKINIGTGYRKFIENGIYDKEFKITIPKDEADEKFNF